MAIEYGEQQISFSAITRESDRITAHLVSEGLKPGAYVGLLFDNTPDLIYSIIGVLNAGCIFVPLDPAWPAARLDNIRKSLGLRHVLTNSTARQLPVTFDKLVTLADWTSPASPIAVSDPPACTDPPAYSDRPAYSGEDALYVYFTSGSTGTPKGIVGKNESLTQFINWEITEFGIDSSYRVSQLISPYFDAFLRDLFVPLFAGGVLCLPPKKIELFTPDELIDWIDHSKIHLIHCVPGVFRIIKDDKACSEEKFSALQYILLSGERIIPAELQHWYTVFKDRIQLVNLYGTTETTLIRSFYRIKPEDTARIRIPVGRPIADTELLVADPEGRACPVLIPGELYIISDYMSKGYLNDPILTESKFIPIGSGPFKGRRAFRTGDKARWLPEGVIELLGREDRQVKLRGIRLEPDEIEREILASGYAKGVVVAILTGQTEEEPETASGSIVAWVLPAEGLAAGTDLAGEIGAWLEKQLPRYMLPVDIREVGAFPLLANGKTDHKRLMDSLKEPEKKTLIDPVSETETRLLAIWKEIFGEKELSTDDSFYKVGGNSLSIMRLIARIYTHFKVRMSLNELFRALTVKSQAAYIDKAVRDLSLKIAKAEPQSDYPLSLSQLRMYFQFRLDPSSLSYNLPVVYEIIEPLDGSRLRSALSALVTRHAMLRTIFINGEEGEPRQIILESMPFQMLEIEKEDINEAISSFIRPFDLNKGPLFRAGFLNCREGRSWLLFDIHHIACDGMSQSILFADFLDIYAGRALQALPLQYKDYAVWEHGYKQSSEYRQQGQFWQQAFKDDIPRLQLPVFRDPVHPVSEEGGHLYFRIEDEEACQLIAGFEQKGIPVFASLYSFFLLFLAQLTGQYDIVIGIASSGRLQQEMEKVIGLFSKTLPIRFKLDPARSLRTTASAVQAYLVQAYDNQLFDLADIQAAIHRHTGTGARDLFDTMLVYQHTDIKQPTADGPKLVPYEYGNKTSKYPLSLIISKEEGSFFCRMEYSSNFFSREDAWQLSLQWRAIISALSRRPDDTILSVIGTATPALAIEEDILFNL